MNSEHEGANARVVVRSNSGFEYRRSSGRVAIRNLRNNSPVSRGRFTLRGLKLFIVHSHYRPGGVRRVIELDPQDAEAYLERARCWDQLGDSTAAARDRSRADELQS